MTAPARRQDYCTQHHQPRSKCEPWDRHGHTMRFREDDWMAAEHAAKTARTDVTALVTQMMEAMLGYARCWRCHPGAPPVPVGFGDLAGRPLREAVADAAEQVISQHPDHHPVTIGRAGVPPVVFAEPGRRAR